LNKNHILISSGLTFIFILFIVIQQFKVGNLGPTSAGEICMEFCTRQGYSASGMPAEISGARSCSCFDDTRNEGLKVPMDSITSGE
jgi:hypothetical protein